MSFSSGTFSLVAGNPVVTGTTISSTVQNNTMNDVATGLTTCVLKDGTQTTTASVPFAFGIDVTTAATTPSTTFALINTTATTVNFAGAASVALNIGHASAAAAFAGGISIPANKGIVGVAASSTISGFLSVGTATVTSPASTNLVLSVASGTGSVLLEASGSGGQVRVTGGSNNLLVDGNIIIGTGTPTGAGTGTTGQITWDTSYIYVCTATNDWRRVALVDF